MGVVYQAWDNELGVPVALKVIRPAAPGRADAGDLERRFKRELLLARQVSHKNVVRIHDLGDVNGTKYISMTYIEGQTLAAVLDDAGRLPLPRALRFAQQIANGLAAAHEVGVVHRDLKPENIMIAGDDEALIMDFGIARSVSAEGTMTVAGTVVGTLEYMAPEQARGEPADQRADVYAVGLLIYDMIAGRRRLTSSESAVAEMMSRIQRPPQPLHAIDPHVPVALDRLVQRCLCPDANERYQSATQVLSDLNAVVDGGGDSTRRQRQTMLVAGIATGVLLAASIITAVIVPRWSTGGAATADIKPISILITDFANRTGDDVFEGALEQGLGIALEEASFISLFRRGDARQLATKLVPGAQGLDRSAGTLVSRREGIDLMVAGAVEPAGSGYRIVVDLIDPATNEAKFSAAEEVAQKSDVLGALADVARRVRAELGESSIALEQRAQRETFTAASMEAAREYSLAQDLQYQGRDEAAIEHYRRAIAADANFGRAYSGWAISADNLGRQEESAEAWKKAVSLIDRMTEREKYRMLGVYHAQVEQNPEKSIEAYETLVRLFPADRAGRANLAVAYFLTRQFQKALEHSGQVIASGSKDPLHQSNHALFAMYAGDFAAAEAQAKSVLASDPQAVTAHVPLAIAALARGDEAAARSEYERMAASGNGRGVSVASLGLADIEMFYGRFAGVETILEPAIARDRSQGSTAGAAAKYVALAEAYLELDRTADAAAAANEGLALSPRLAVKVAAARVLLRAGRAAGARAVAAELSRQVSRESQAYAHLIEGELALAANEPVKAIEAFRKALALADLWLARFGSGIAHLSAEQPAAALAELEQCDKRRGEAVAVFLDDRPSYRYLAVLPYWLGRAHDALGVRASAIASYERFLALRPESRNPLVLDAQRRLGK